MQKNIIITLILSIFIAVFATLNSAAVPVNLIFTKVNLSAALVILISASIGAIIVYSIDAISKLKSKRKIKESEKTISSLTDDNKKLLEENKSIQSELSLLKEDSAKYEKEISALKAKIESVNN